MRVISLFALLSLFLMAAAPAMAARGPGDESPPPKVLYR